MRAIPRNPRSVRPTDDEPEELGREDGYVVLVARKAVMQVVERLSPKDSGGQLFLVATASAGLFVDVVNGLSREGAFELVMVVNQGLEGSGWQLVPEQRN
jgi:hypothetical protein